MGNKDYSKEQGKFRKAEGQPGGDVAHQEELPEERSESDMWRKARVLVRFDLS